MEVAKYDSAGRMMYHPGLHPNHKKPWTSEELEYLCKFYEVDGPKTISLALGKTERTILSKVHILRKMGLYEHYKKTDKFYVSIN